MAKCDNCKELEVKNIRGKVPFEWCEKKNDNPDKNIERDCPYFKPKTNADRIRNMTDEELAKFLESVTCETHGWCDDCTSMRGEYCHGLNDESNSLVQERLKWLKSEAECEK